jgi:hypothetical protein
MTALGASGGQGYVLAPTGVAVADGGNGASPTAPTATVSTTAPTKVADTAFNAQKGTPRRMHRALVTAVCTICVFICLPSVLVEFFRVTRRYILFVPSLFMARRTPPKINLLEWANADPARACVLELRDAHARNDVTPARIRCCIRKIRKQMPLALTQRDKPVLLSLGFSTHFISKLPEHDMPRFKTCAIVSNAPSLRLRDFGTNLSREIDSANAVFRLNKAPVEGFEQFVGAKEKFRLINLHQGVSTDPSVVRSFERKTTVLIRDENYMRSSTTNVSTAWNILRYSEMGALDEYIHLRNSYPDSPIYLNHPVFAEFALNYLHTNILEPTKTKSLSTGTEAVVLAMMLCDTVTSYEVCSNDPASSTHRYYYDMVGSRGYRWYHPKNVEGALLKLMSSRRRLGTSIYEYDLAGDADRCPSEAAAGARRARLRNKAVPS